MQTWQRVLLAVLVASATMAYSMGRAMPHHCHEVAFEHGDGHDEEESLAADCPICDIALPVVDGIVSPASAPGVSPTLITYTAVEVGCLRVLPEFGPARGPPLS